MAIKSVAELKSFFETGDKPTQQQFYDWLESFIHQTEGIAIANVAGLVAALVEKADQVALQLLIDLVKPIRLILEADGSYEIPAGKLMERLIITPIAETTLKVGITPAGNEVLEEEILDADSDKIVDYVIVARAAGNLIYFTGIVAQTTVLIYTKTLEHSNV